MWTCKDEDFNQLCPKISPITAPEVLTQLLKTHPVIAQARPVHLQLASVISVHCARRLRRKGKAPEGGREGGNETHPAGNVATEEDRGRLVLGLVIRQRVHVNVVVLLVSLEESLPHGAQRHRPHGEEHKRDLGGARNGQAGPLRGHGRPPQELLVAHAVVEGPHVLVGHHVHVDVLLRGTHRRRQERRQNPGSEVSH